ncbi:flagellar brake protein [Aromatoleum evansii]|uniref:flagellar brake protein n=1 Tax=Aromatoleum evansii TaxID=59406 RepID=UPI00145C5194|nr:flagellar brake protein [Aromatoleum evansii]NMG28067.1 flagellar brake protein [Aromatoleum evansii]
MTLDSVIQKPVAFGVETASDAGSAASSPAGDATPTPRKVFAFDDMHLQVGDRLQLECPAQMGIGRVFVRVVGYLENASLIVTAPTHGGQRVNLVDNDTVVIRAFSRQSAFAFRSSVLRTCRLPFDYLHLSFPEVVHGSVIRKSTRVRTHLPAKCLDAGGEAQAAVIENISSTGILLALPHSPGARGEIVHLEFDAHLHDVDTRLNVEAEIVSVAPGPSGSDAAWRCGLEFRNLEPGDRMVIKGLVYQQIIENPSSIA